MQDGQCVRRTCACAIGKLRFIMSSYLSSLKVGRSLTTRHKYAGLQSKAAYLRQGGGVRTPNADDYIEIFKMYK